jgi:hypothetical protein
MDLFTLIRNLQADGTVQTLATNPLAQFGPPTRQYMGATLMPERVVPLNAYREQAIRYRTVIANSGTRYSPAQLKDDTSIVGSMLVELGNQDIARQFTGEDYDAFIQLLNSRPSMDAVVALIRWLDVTVLRAILDLNEKMRWDCLVAASVVMTGDNGYTETVTYPNPSGHRVNAGGTWSSDAYDPYPDIIAQVQLLADKGYQVGRMVASRKVATILARNAKMQARVGGRISVSTSGQLASEPRPLISLADLNAVFNADGLPPIEINDQRYFDYAGTHRFFPDTSLLLAATTGQDQAIIEQNYYDNDTIPIAENILGYFAVGRAVGQSAPGRVIQLEAKTDKPPRVEAQGWQTGLPVLLEPESVAVINAIG